MDSKSDQAFTLIELLVVIAIIGILAGFIIVSMSGASSSANDSRRKADINQLAKAVMIWKTNNPDTLFPVDIDGCNIGDDCTDIFGSASVLRDPNGSYYTYTSADGTDFTITAELSNTNSYSFDSSTGRYSEVSSNPINGICGTANKVFYVTSSDYGDSNFCNVGTLSSTPVFPEIGQTVNWTCIGADGGTTASCSATRSASSCIDVAGLDCNEYTVGTDTVNVYTLTGSSTTSTTWTVPAGVTEVEYLVVAGGGGGGGQVGGGGGAGGFLTGSLSVSLGDVSIIVGKGGVGGNYPTSYKGGDGESSVLSYNGTVITASGGGGGGAYGGLYNGNPGGSGGGAGYTGSYGVANGNPISQGNDGGPYSAFYSGGGGGGAGGAGLGGTGSLDTAVGGIGGSGLSSSITGSSLSYAGGGGGCGQGYSGTATAGGGAGSAGRFSPSYPGIDGTGGGGGGGRDYAGGKGGAGVVVIRYSMP